MSVRLRQISLSGTGLIASQNTGCIVNDSDSGFLMESNGTTWNEYAGPALGVVASATDGISPSRVSGATLYDPSYGFVYSNGTSWQVPARDLEHEVGLQYTGAGLYGLDSPQYWPCPRLPGGAGNLTGTTTPAIGTVYLYPFTIPSRGTAVGLWKVSYDITTPDAAGVAEIGTFFSVGAGNQFPSSLIYSQGSVSEASGGYRTTTLGTANTFARGTRIWIAYLRTAGAATLKCQAEGTGPGDLGYGILGGVSFEAKDVLTCTGTFGSMPGTLAPNHWTLSNTSDAPQLFISFTS